MTASCHLTRAVLVQKVYIDFGDHHIGNLALLGRELYGLIVLLHSFLSESLVQMPFHRLGPSQAEEKGHNFGFYRRLNFIKQCVELRSC